MVKTPRLARFALPLLLLGAFACTPAVAGVVNGDFETGDFTGWTLTSPGCDSFCSVVLVSDPGVPLGGNLGASFGPFGDTGGITQDLATELGKTYTVDFWLKNEPAPDLSTGPNLFQLQWGGNTVTALTNAPVFDYTEYSFNEVATSTLTTLGFNFRNDPAFWDLDNVSVTVAAVPEPASWALAAAGLLALTAQRRRVAARR